MKTSKIVVLAILCLTISAIYAERDTSTADYLDSTYNAGEKTIALVLDRIRPHLTTQQKKFSDVEKFAITSHSNYGAFARLDAGQVIIPINLIIETRFILWAYEDLERDPTLLPRIAQYMTYLENIQRNRALGKPESPMLTFSRWNGHQRLKRNENEQAREIGLLVNALAFVIAHELAHLVLQHKEASSITPMESRKQESAADRYAIRWIVAADFEPLPAAIVLLRLGAGQITENGRLIQNSTHPHPLCRVWMRFAPLLYRRRNEPELNAGAIKAGYTSAEAMAIEMTKFKAACRDGDD